MNPIETVRDVKLDHMNRAILGVDLNKALKDTREDLPKLYSLQRSKGKGVSIDTVKAEVHNSTWVAFMLRNHAKETNSEIG